MPRNFRLIIAYDGTNYAGWQRQENAPTVQEAIEKVLQRVLREKISLAGASRTDAGTHALGQVAHFRTASRLSSEVLLKALNGLLPRDIRTLKVEEVPLSFHSRYQAKEKLYRYTLVTAPQVLPQERFFVYHYPYSLHLKAMRQGSKFLIGTHDFSAFQGSDTKRKSKNNRRRITRFSILQKNDRLIFEVSANGFLYTMVRVIAGTLLEIGIGKRIPENIQELLKKRDRRLAGPTVPARGLCLVRVGYS